MLTAVEGRTCEETSVTPFRVTVIFCSSVTPVSGTVMVLPEKVAAPAVPVPDVTVALPLTTFRAKVNTSV